MIDYLLVVFHSPIKRYHKIINDRYRVQKTLLLIGIMGILYTFTVAVGYKRGFGAVLKPVLPIAADDYYFYEMFFTIPAFFLISLVFSLCVRLFSRILGGKGTFKNALVIYATSSIVPTLLTMWIPETILIVFFPHLRAEPLGGFKVIPYWMDIARQVLGIIWPLAISAIGIKVSEKIHPLKAGLVALFSFMVTAGIMLLFIR